MDKLDCMSAFCQVVKQGGFSAAARKMGISKVVVSRAVSQLEADLDLRLLQRTTRTMSPTAEGLAYFEKCQPLLEEFNQLDNLIKEKHQTASGQLKIAAPSEAFSQQYLVPLLIGFKQQYPEVKLEITFSDRYFDIVDEGFDLAIRIGALEDSSLIARKLSDFEIILTATPEYLALNPTITEPSDIATHKIILDTNYKGGKNWLFKQNKQKQSVKVEPDISLNSALSAKSFLLANQGLCLSPSFVVNEQVKSGALTRLLSDWQITNGGIYLVYSHRKYLSAKVNLFSQYIMDNFKKEDCATDN